MLLSQVLEIIGAISAFCTAVAPFFPKGSRVGYALSKIGVDLKGHTSPTLQD